MNGEQVWQSFKPVIWIAALAGVVLLALAGMVAQGVDKIIIPPPENAASKLVGALAAHRYEGAMHQLSQDLQQQVRKEDLIQLMQRIEQSPAQGIQHATGQDARQQGDQATAQVQVKLGNNEETSLELPLRKENGVWKVSSIDPLRSLAGQ